MEQIRPKAPDDTAALVIIEVMILIFLFATLIIFMVTFPAPGPTIPGHQHAAYQTETLLYDDLAALDRMCCAQDPTSASLLQNRLLKAYTGNVAPLEEALWRYSDNAHQNIQLHHAWNSINGPPTLTLPIYQPTQPQGATVGITHQPEHSPLAPLHLIPILDNATQAAGLDLHHIPTKKFSPYTPEIPFINTQTTYQSTDPTADHTVKRDGYTQLTATPRPAMALAFKEPPWQAILEDELPIAPEGEDHPKEYAQVITKDDLLAERALQEPDNPLGEGVYPQHGFQVDTHLQGPGILSNAPSNSNQYDEGDTVTLLDAYTLTITIPPGWQDVELVQADKNDNQDAGWNTSRTTVKERPAEGGYVITAHLDVNGTYTDDYEHDNPQTAHIILNEDDAQTAPFRFHARPPPQTAHDEMGFHEIIAHLQHGPSLHHETNRLIIEIPTDPGRAHRTITSHTPSNLPGTHNETTNDPLETTIPLGATIKNGAETVTINQITWHAPPNTFQSTPKNSDDILTTPPNHEPDTDNWDISNDGDILYWNASVDCQELHACPIAANITLNGTPHDPILPHRPTHAQALYDEDDIQPYLNWHIRHDRGTEGVPVRFDHNPGFAIAHHTQHAHAGVTHGASLWHITPSSTPLCEEDDKNDRNQATGQRRGNRVYYDFGPQENGLPVIGPRIDTADPCLTPDDDYADTFPIIATNQDNSTVEAIGKATYNAIQGLDHTTYNQWRNGLAESRIDAPRSAPMGTTLRSAVYLDSLYHTLQYQGVSHATVKAKMIDPYNAWNEDAWYDHLVINDGKITINDQQLSPSCEPFNNIEGDHPCTQETEVPIADPDEAPSKLALPIPIPERTIPGTHVILIEVSWEINLDGGLLGDDVTIQQTGRIIETVDIFLPNGERATPSHIEALTWYTDW